MYSHILVSTALSIVGWLIVSDLAQELRQPGQVRQAKRDKESDVDLVPDAAQLSVTKQVNV